MGMIDEGLVLVNMIALLIGYISSDYHYICHPPFRDCRLSTVCFQC